ncbi:hypothetical protein SAMN04488007_3471 [Maribacter aquivivus]|uniref:Uncharacterized protein n=1 Tax=Maribacter aquivivus TaxID=228958 RepID=A0A1M6U3B7_9FLAO|nr:hypothetical protein [Maribacter aquivivus]SHK63775.1 hypothetical protein SAMN04488007_3471 [Maribacter aquivivus]
MLTAEEYYINKKVRDEITSEPETYRFNLSLIDSEASVPLIDFARLTLEEYENLRLMLSVSEGVDEFIIHSYYYLLDQVSYYESIALPNQIATEMAMEDLRVLFSNYNEKKLQL